MKAFKYFDLNNDGTCEPHEFAKAIEKIGILIPTKNELNALFSFYDADGSGSITYKEFSEALFKKPSQGAPPSRGGTRGRARDNTQNEALAERLKKKLISRGARGIIGLGKSFRIMDDNNSRSLDVHEFGKAIKDYKLGFTEAETRAIYDFFDINKDGEIDYDEFLRQIRGPMAQCRKKLVMQAFDKLDKDGSGWIDINDIRDVYSAKSHPDVLSGKKTEDDVLLEFLETFETHHNVMNSEAPDHVITKDEFTEYYANISASIDNDEYFELMMNNAWKINSGAKSHGKGWSNQAAGRHGSPFRPGPKAEMKFTPGAFQTSSQSYGTSGKVDDFVSEEEMKTAVGKFRAKLISRGARGFIGLQRQFKIMDDDNSKTLDKMEFKKAIKDFRVGVSDDDIATIWAAFDIDGNGTISYDEFVRGVRGPMNKFRQGLVKKAFTILDKDGSGVVDASDIKGVYNASRHPDVISGKKTEDEILGDFLETFESHHNLHAGRKNDQSVTWEEFIEYYNNISASIDNDEYFELMMNNAWNLDKKRVTKKGWGGEV